MKIVHYLNHAREANGHVAVAIDLACEQSRLGHDVHLISGPCDFMFALDANGVKYHEVKEVSGRLRFLGMARELRPITATIKPDIINAHMVASALAAKIVQLGQQFKLITTVHNAFDRQSVFMRVGNRVIAVSEAVRRQMIARGIPERKLRVVLNGTIGGARRAAYPPQIMNLARPALVTVAGLHERKGISFLIKAFDDVYRVCNDAHLYIVGEGPERRSYEELAKAQESGDHIHFTGHLDDPRAAMASADIFVLASLQDPFPLVLSEARQMGCAIVASNVDGIPEALWHGKKGVLVPPGDARHLAESLITLLLDERKRAHLASAALADTYDITVYAMNQKTIEVYSVALGRRLGNANDH